MPTSGSFLLWLTVLYGLGTLVPLFYCESKSAERERLGNLKSLDRSTRIPLILALVASVIAFAFSGGICLGLDPLAPTELALRAFPLGPLQDLHLAVRLDRLGAFFVVIISGFSALVAIYSFGALKARHFDDHRHRVTAAFNAFVWSTLLVVQVADVLSLLFALELMSLSFGYLAMFKHLLFEQEDKEARESAQERGEAPPVLSEHETNKRHNAFLAPQVYLMASHVSTAFLLVAVSILALNAGSLTFDGISAHAHELALSPTATSLVFLLSLAGLGIRIGLTPAHVWVPLVHPSSPTPTHALSLGIAIKVGIYLMFRFFFEFTEPQVWWGWLLLLVAGVTALANVWYAIASHDLKEALAYHSIENIGIIVAGIGIALIFLPAANQLPAAPWIAGLALIASLYHLLNHAVFKGLLYMATGSIDNLTGRVVEFDQLGGLIRRWRWTFAAFMVGALASAGAPPLNGFVSWWLMLQSIFYGLIGNKGVDQAVLLLALILFVAAFALTAFCFFKMVGLVFLGQPRQPENRMAGWERAGMDSPPAMLAPMAFMALLCVLLGLAPGYVAPWIGEIVEPYVKVALIADTTGSDNTAKAPALIEESGGSRLFGLELPMLAKLAESNTSKDRDNTDQMPEPPAPTLPMAGLVAVAGVLMLLGWLGLRNRVRGPSPADAWNCGRPFTRASMQSTAASLSELIRSMADWANAGARPPDDGGIAYRGASTPGGTVGDIGKSSEPNKKATSDAATNEAGEPGEPTEKDRNDRIIFIEWYRLSAYSKHTQWVREVFRVGFNWLSRWLFDSANALGLIWQNGDIRSYVRYILLTEIAILFLFLALVIMGNIPGGGR